MSAVDVYPVGLFRDVRQARVDRRRGRPAFRRLARTALRRRAWRRVSYWNGYLAEPSPWPDGLRTCGHGWTRRRALARLDRYLARDGASL